jgi:hypothetical protein
MSLPIADDPVITGMTNDTGTGQDGDVVNKAMFEAIAEAIDEALVDSTTPSAQTPAETTAEVIEARGTLASLDARISGVIDENGVAIGDTKVVEDRGVCGEDIDAGEVAYMSDQLGVEGLWYRADASAQYSSAAAKVIGMCVASALGGASTTFRRLGRFSDVLTGLAPGAEYFISETAGELTATAPAIRRSVGVARTSTDLIITDDLVSAGAMRGPVCMRIASSTTSVGTSGTGTTETTLVTHTILGGTLRADQDTLELDAVMQINCVGASTIKVKFGSATIATVTVSVGANRVEPLRVQIKRIGAAAQICFVYAAAGVDSPASGATLLTYFTSQTQNLAADVALVITGTNGNPADVITHLCSTVRTI